MKKIVFRVFVFCMAVFAMLLSSCSGSDYINAIPKSSTALISIDMQKMAERNHLSDKASVLKSLLHVDDVADCGIDATEKLYLFETADGTLGLCAKVSSEDDLENWLSQLAKEQRVCQPVSERKGFHFSVLKDNWLIGFSDKSLLVMGPVVADAQSELQRQMVKYLKADEEQGIQSSRLFDSLDSISSPMAMVAQAQALPEKFIAPFTLGAPKGTDASQIVIAAEMNINNGLLRIKGKTFSFNSEVNASLEKANQNYRPIKGKYVMSMPDDAMAGIFMNVNGTQFLPMMQSNKGIQQLLLGINAAVDMDNIIRSVDGDWKESCPKGSSIADWGKNAYYYTDGKTSFYFGVTDDSQFYSGSDELLATYAVKESNHPLPAEIRKEIVGQKLAMVINLGKSVSSNAAMSAVTSLLTPIFGNLSSVVYTLK